jgi:hypothetical protein
MFCFCTNRKNSTNIQYRVAQAARRQLRDNDKRIKSLFASQAMYAKRMEYGVRYINLGQIEKNESGEFCRKILSLDTGVLNVVVNPDFSREIQSEGTT